MVNKYIKIVIRILTFIIILLNCNISFAQTYNYHFKNDFIIVPVIYFVEGGSEYINGKRYLYDNIKFQYESSKSGWLRIEYELSRNGQKERKIVYQPITKGKGILNCEQKITKTIITENNVEMIRLGDLKIITIKMV